MIKFENEEFRGIMKTIIDERDHFLAYEFYSTLCDKINYTKQDIDTFALYEWSKFDSICHFHLFREINGSASF